MVSRVAAIAIVVGCGAHPQRVTAPRANDDVTLYRDLALVKQRIVLDVPTAATSVVVSVAAGVPIDHVLVADRGGLTIAGLHASAEPPAAAKADKAAATCATANETGSGPALVPAPCDDDDDDDNGDTAPTASAVTVAKATELRLDVSAPRAGRYAIELAYLTDRLHWDAAYTMTASPARDRAVLRGAVAIRNEMGIALHRARIHVVDAEVRASRGKAAEHLASTLIGGTPSSTPMVVPRDLGIVELPEGESRIELLPSESPRAMRSVLVYDPIGTKLDNAVAGPNRDPLLGAHPAAPTRVTESFEVQRDEQASEGLPAGPVRLLERRPDGSVAVLGESRLFDPATRVANVDTIAIGTAEGVTGHRIQQEFTDDEEGRRLTEELVITIANARARPVSVLIREHLYRGQNWTLAYHTAPSAEKEGSQQIALRTDVPAKGAAKILYVVVYTWDR